MLDIINDIINEPRNAFPGEINSNLSGQDGQEIRNKSPFLHSWFMQCELISLDMYNTFQVILYM